MFQYLSSLDAQRILWLAQIIESGQGNGYPEIRESALRALYFKLDSLRRKDIDPDNSSPPEGARAKRRFPTDIEELMPDGTTRYVRLYERAKNAALAGLYSFAQKNAQELFDYNTGPKVIVAGDLVESASEGRVLEMERRESESLEVSEPVKLESTFPPPPYPSIADWKEAYTEEFFQNCAQGMFKPENPR